MIILLLLQKKKKKKAPLKLLCSKWVNLLCISNANIRMQKGRLTFWG